MIKDLNLEFSHAWDILRTYNRISPTHREKYAKKNIIVTTMIEKCHIMVRLLVVITIFMIVITILWLLQYDLTPLISLNLQTLYRIGIYHIQKKIVSSTSNLLLQFQSTTTITSLKRNKATKTNLTKCCIRTWLTWLFLFYFDFFRFTHLFVGFFPNEIIHITLLYFGVS